MGQDREETGSATGGGAPALPAWATQALRGVPPGASREFISGVSLLRACPGAVLSRPDAPTQVVLFVASGTVRLDRPAGRGRVTLALLGPGELVGEVAAVDDEPRTATVTAVEPAELAAVSRAAFVRALDRVPGFAANVIRLLATRLRDADATVVSLASMEVDRRVARQLLAFGDRYGIAGADGAVRVPLRLTQQDLASLVGASRERTNRALVAYKRRGWIAVDRDFHVTIVRPDLLAKRVNNRF